MKFNPDKRIIGANKIRYFGHILSSNGMKPDPDKVSAIIGMKPLKTEQRNSVRHDCISGKV
jgi:hypothetical protein